jgi:LmbE family N-acetylglucosaminyl deacetylase
MPQLRSPLDHQHRLASVIDTFTSLTTSSAQVPRSAIPGIRQGEQKAAAVVLGVSDVRFLGYPDGCIEPTYALRRDITRQIRQVQPSRVLTWSPSGAGVASIGIILITEPPAKQP